MSPRSVIVDVAAPSGGNCEVTRPGEDLATRFAVIDGQEEVMVEYVGILPDLFREGQGVIARGTMDESGLFAATEVLAKHDENYMPPEVADALEQTGHTVRTAD